MSTQKNTTNTSSKSKAQTQDYISQIKKETGGQKENKTNEVNELDWERTVSDEEEETVQTTKKGLIEQGKVGTDKPRKLKDLFDNEPAKPKPKKTQPAEGAKERQKLEGKADVSSKPKFFNSTGVPSKEGEQVSVQKPAVSKKYDKEETVKKFTNTKEILSRAAEENAKIKPTKDYLDGESKVTYKEEPALEKPKFMSKLPENATEPRFAEIDKSEDLFLKKIAEKNLNLENAYKDQKENKDGERERKPFQKKEFKKEREYKPRHQEKKEEEPEVDSDGFVIYTSEKKKKHHNYEDRQYKKQYRENKEYKGKKPYGKKNQGDNEKPKEEAETKDETKEENVEKTEEKKEEPATKNVSAKAVVKISTQGAKSLKDLF